MLYYSGWKLQSESRKLLFNMIDLKYDIVRCDHVTHELSDGPLRAPWPEKIAVVGMVDSGFMQAFLVEVNGMLRRPDGKLYHITYSYEQGHESREANDIILAFQPQLNFYYEIAADPFVKERLK